eukprot:CAMPEP_0194446298 /NCGR_PEP_ID=MMETSP0176-20130528/128358_1 /TAXON_ID=216777 /ORGANISM="Proboscia alata, Strain PI-D3" /LENGTH=42 /DNA_ID= /DNA_START= /DNA_END= /DNA_ORIENTATION=
MADTKNEGPYSHHGAGDGDEDSSCSWRNNDSGQSDILKIRIN